MVERMVNNCKECRASWWNSSGPLCKSLAAPGILLQKHLRNQTHCHSTAQTPTHSGFQATARGVQIEALDKQGSIAQVRGQQCAAMHGFNNTMLESGSLGKKQGNQKKASRTSPNYLECHSTLSKAAPMQPELLEERNPLGMSLSGSTTRGGNAGSLRPLSVTFPFVMNVGRSDWGVGRRLALFSLLDPLPLRNQQIPGTAFTVCGSY